MNTLNLSALDSAKGRQIPEERLRQKGGCDGNCGSCGKCISAKSFSEFSRAELLAIDFLSPQQQKAEPAKDNQSRTAILITELGLRRQRITASSSDAQPPQRLDPLFRCDKRDKTCDAQATILEAGSTQQILIRDRNEDGTGYQKPQATPIIQINNCEDYAQPPFKGEKVEINQPKQKIPEKEPGMVLQEAKTSAATIWKEKRQESKPACESTIASIASHAITAIHRSIHQTAATPYPAAQTEPKRCHSITSMPPRTSSFPSPIAMIMVAKTPEIVKADPTLTYRDFQSQKSLGEPSAVRPEGKTKKTKKLKLNEYASPEAKRPTLHSHTKVKRPEKQQPGESPAGQNRYHLEKAKAAKNSALKNISNRIHAPPKKRGVNEIIRLIELLSRRKRPRRRMLAARWQSDL